MLYEVITLAADLRPQDKTRLAELSQSLSIPEGELQAALARAQLRQPVLDAIQRPWEAKPWHQYRPIFLTEARIQAGADFWRQHAADLARAERTYHRITSYNVCYTKLLRQVPGTRTGSGFSCHLSHTDRLGG